MPYSNYAMSEQHLPGLQFNNPTKSALDAPPKCFISKLNYAHASYSN